MDVWLHFGQHRDVRVIREQISLLDGVVIPAHILAHQHPSTSAFVSSLPASTPYLIDPATYRFQNSGDKHLNSAGDLRPSSRKLCDAYHPTLADLVLNHGRLKPDLLPTPSELTESVLDFQLQAVADGSSKSAAAKYLDRYDKRHLKDPRVLVPPYFRFEVPGDKWYAYSLDCAMAARVTHTEREIAPIVLAPIDAFRDASLVQVLKDYEGFENIILWFDDYNELFMQAGQIGAVRNAIQMFRKQSRVDAHYGGYLLLLSAHDGLESIGHGILYTQHKSYEVTAPGAGGVAERYYIPRLRQFRSLSQTDLILHRFPELICGCRICEDTMGGNPDRIRHFYDDSDLLRMHFIEARRKEADAVKKRSLAEEAEDLRETYAKYHGALSILRNPDAVVSGARMRGLEVLLAWADGISA